MACRARGEVLSPSAILTAPVTTTGAVFFVGIAAAYTWWTSIW